MATRTTTRTRSKRNPVQQAADEIETQQAKPHLVKGDGTRTPPKADTEPAEPVAEQPGLTDTETGEEITPVITTLNNLGLRYLALGDQITKLKNDQDAVRDEIIKEMNVHRKKIKGNIYKHGRVSIVCNEVTRLRVESVK